MALKLLRVIESERARKKLKAVFSDGREVHFGARGYSDFTLHGDEARKHRYLTRHRANEDWADPQSPGALARWILWNKPTVAGSVRDFKRRFAV